MSAVPIMLSVATCVAAWPCWPTRGCSPRHHTSDFAACLVRASAAHVLALPLLLSAAWHRCVGTLARQQSTVTPLVPRPVLFSFPAFARGRPGEV